MDEPYQEEPYEELLTPDFIASERDTLWMVEVQRERLHTNTHTHSFVHSFVTARAFLSCAFMYLFLFYVLILSLSLSGSRGAHRAP